MTAPTPSMGAAGPGAPAPESPPEARASGVTAGPGLDIAGLETVYDLLARALDEAGPGKAELFLVKLALLNAEAIGDAARFDRHVKAALQDLRARGAGSGGIA